jgi:hypothetical protein
VNWRISLPYATFRLETTDGYVTFAAPIAKWAKGKDIGHVIGYYWKKGADIHSWE